MADTHNRIDTEPSFELSHDGVHWAGSFQQALAGICADMLSDGPLPVRLTVMCERSGSDETETVEGELCGFGDGHLELSDGVRVDAATILAVAF